MTPSSKRGAGGVGLALAAVVLLGACGSGADTAPTPDGTLRPLGFGTQKRIELFVPDGWNMINQNDLQHEDPTNPQPANGVTYAIVDTARIPETLSAATATDAQARAEFRRQALGGAAITAQFTELGPCDAVRSMLHAAEDAVDFTSIEDADSGLGEDRRIGESARTVDGAEYHHVRYFATVPMSSSHCVGLTLGATLQVDGGSGDAGDAGAADGGGADAVGRARTMIEVIADNSTTDESKGAGEGD